MPLFSSSSLVKVITHRNHLTTLIMKRITLIILFLGMIWHISAQQKHTFEIKDGNFMTMGKRCWFTAARCIMPAFPHWYWKHRLQMTKAMGQTRRRPYASRNHHETAPGVWTSKRNRNLWSLSSGCHRRAHGNPAPLDMPCPMGIRGYPWWLVKNPDLVIRTNNKPFHSCNVYIHKLIGQVRDLQITLVGGYHDRPKTNLALMLPNGEISRWAG